MEKITVTNMIDEQTISDVLVTAFEGGINYWCPYAVKVDHWPENASYASDVVAQGFPVDIYIEDEDTWQTLTLDKVMKGIELFLALRNESISYLNGPSFDADDADLVVQYALFGEIVYG